MRHSLVSCDWCGDTTQEPDGDQLPAGWLVQQVPVSLAGAVLRGSRGTARWEGPWELCPDCVLAYHRLIAELDQRTVERVESAIAGQRRPRTAGPWHSKVVLKGRDG